MIEILRLATADDVAQEAASRAAQDIFATQAAHKPAVFVLAGGRLPPVAALILAQKYTSTFNWSQVTFLIGDERCAPRDSPDASWNAFAPLFAAHPEIPAEHRVRPHSEKSAEAAAADYEHAVQAVPGGMFTHLWLGMGEDGHTLSLFPGNPAATEQTSKLVAAVHDSPKPPADRITFTYAALRKAQSAVVFITGASKAPVLKQIADGDHSLPIVTASQTIAKAGGHVTWIIDDEAASLLDNQELKI